MRERGGGREEEGKRRRARGGGYEEGGGREKNVWFEISPSAGNFENQPIHIKILLAMAKPS